MFKKCATCPYYGDVCGQPTSCPGGMLDTAVILFAGDQVEGPVMGESPLKGLMQEMAAHEAMENWASEFIKNLPPEEFVPRYNMRIEGLLRQRLAEDNYMGLPSEPLSATRFRDLYEGHWPEPEAFGFFPEVEFRRADGGVECKVCGAEYRKHPIYPLFPNLNVLCDGRLVKL